MGSGIEGNSINYDDLPPVRKLGRYFWLAWFTASMGQFVDAYDTLIIGAALIYLMPLWKLTPVETGLLAASAFIGGVALGAIIFGPIADRMGRRLLYIYDLVFFVIFGAYQLRNQLLGVIRRKALTWHRHWW